MVSAVLRSAPATRVPTVPITAAGTPACCRPPSASRVVVVLPWVPVTPIIRSAVAGSPYTRRGQAAQHARAGRSTTSSGYAAAGAALGARRVGEHGDRARGDRGGGEVDAVGAGARQGGVQVAGQDPLRAQREPGDPGAAEVAAGRAASASAPPSQVGEVGQGSARGRRGRVAASRSSLTTRRGYRPGGPRARASPLDREAARAGCRSGGTA